MREIYDLDKSLEDRDYYLKEKKTLAKEILDNYALRKKPTAMSFHGEKLETTYGGVLTALFMMNAYVGSGISLTKDDLFLEPAVTQDALKDYFNNIITNFRANHWEDFDVVEERIYETLNETSDISEALNHRRGNGISYTDNIKLMVTDPEYDKLTHPVVQEGQYAFIEKQFNDETSAIMNYMATHEDCEMYPYAVSGTGLNKKQVCQMYGFIGLKPDITNKVIPVTITDNFIGGLKSLTSYFINAKGTRLAMITNKKFVGRSGYLTNKLTLANIDHFHDNSIKDCGTKHFLVYSVDSPRKLRMIIGRHYYDLNEKGEKASDELHTVTKNSMDLVGKKIGLRSPVTCCGDHVCATCYGRHLSEINKDLNTGLVAVYKLTDPLTQRLLSAKHLLTTKTDKVDWGDVFSEYFDVNMDCVYFNQDKEFTLIIKKPSADTYDEDEDMYTLSDFEIQPAGVKKHIKYTSPTKLFINPKVLTVEALKDESDVLEISSKAINEDDFIFKYQPKNNALTKSLQQILDLIESNDHLGITDYNEFVNKFCDLLIENDMDSINSVHIEMITSTLLKDAETHERVDFSHDTLRPYVINRVSKTVMEAPLAISLSFERLNDQLIDLNTYKKDGSSIKDYLFN